MKRLLYTLLALVLLLCVYGGYILNSTGYFRKVENTNTQAILQSIPLYGTEDLTVSQQGEFVLISATKRGVQYPNADHQDGLYFMDLREEGAQPRLISGKFEKEFHPHGIDMIRLDSCRHRLFVINHVDELNTVEVFTLHNRDSLVFEESLADPQMFSPNDIVALGDREFYFTNDKNATNTLGKFQENYLGKAACKITYFDGKEYRTVADDLAYANGINYDAERELMYIASSRGFLVNVYQREKNGDLTLLKTIPCETGVDNIELDTNGDLWIGCHPNLMAFKSYSQGKKEKAPSEIIKLVYQEDGSHSLESFFVDDGSNVSASSTAAVFNDKVIVGNVMDDHFLILKK
jgi:arylesterase/paraoxonase